MIRGAALIAALAAGFVLAQEIANIQAERVATSLQYVMGAVWARDGFLVFSDTVKRKVYRLDPGSPPKPTPVSGAGAQGLTYDVQGRLYYCELLQRRIMRMDRRGKSEVFLDQFEGKKFNAPKDIVVRRDGHVYFIDPAFATAIDTRELPFNGIFHVTPKGEVEAIAKWQTRPNGIALAGDGKTLFVTDADRHAVVAITIDGRGGFVSQRDFATGIEGVPAGLRLDVTGRVYVGEHGLGVYSPEGKREQLLLPGEVVTNCAFGDNDFESLYVCGRKSVYKVRLGVKGALQY